MSELRPKRQTPPNHEKIIPAAQSHDPPPRQLRLLHLQPRPVPRRARLPGRSPSQRQNHRRRHRPPQARSHRHLPRPVHAQRSRYHRRTRPTPHRKISNFRCLLGPSSHRRGIRWENHPCAQTFSRQNQLRPSRRQRRLPQTLRSLHRNALPLADHRTKISATRTHHHRRNLRRHHHGRPPPPRQPRRRPGPPRIRPHHQRQTTPPKFPLPLVNLKKDCHSERSSESAFFNAGNQPTRPAFTNSNPPKSPRTSPSHSKSAPTSNSHLNYADDCRNSRSALRSTAAQYPQKYTSARSRPIPERSPHAHPSRSAPTQSPPSKPANPSPFAMPDPRLRPQSSRSTHAPAARPSSAHDRQQNIPAIE